MTRFLFTFAIGLLVGIVIGYRVSQRTTAQTVNPCPEYKVYGEEEVKELETQAKTRRLSK